MKKIISVVLIFLILVTGCDKAKDIVKPVKMEDDIIKGSAVAYYGWKTVFLGLAAVSGYISYQFGNTGDGIGFGVGAVISLIIACIPFGGDTVIDNRILKLNGRDVRYLESIRGCKISKEELKKIQYDPQHYTTAKERELIEKNSRRYEKADAVRSASYNSGTQTVSDVKREKSTQEKMGLVPNTKEWYARQEYNRKMFKTPKLSPMPQYNGYTPVNKWY